MDSLVGMCEWVSDSRDSAWLANPCELQIRITDVLCPHHVGSAYGRAIRTISRTLVNHCRTRANPCELRTRITVPERVYRESGYIHNYNNRRLKRKMQKRKGQKCPLLPDYGLDFISYV